MCVPSRVCVCVCCWAGIGKFKLFSKEPGGNEVLGGLRSLLLCPRISMTSSVLGYTGENVSRCFSRGVSFFFSSFQTARLVLGTDSLHKFRFSYLIMTVMLNF